MDRTRRLNRRGRPEVRASDRVFLHFVGACRQIVEVHNRGHALLSDRQELLNPHIERARKGESITRVRVRADEFGSLVQSRHRHQPCERLSVLYLAITPSWMPFGNR